MTAFQKVSSYLQLSEVDQKAIQECLNGYSDYSRIKTLTNALYSFIGRSDWQIAKSTIQERVIIRLDELLSNEKPEELKRRSAIVSEFILRYLITETTCEYSRPNFQLTQELRTTEKLWEMELPEITFRASYGNGSTLPRLEPEIVRKRLNDLVSKLNVSITKATSMIMNKRANIPTYEAIHELSKPTPFQQTLTAARSLRDIAAACRTNELNKTFFQTHSAYLDLKYRIANP
ncbi:MAG: hypothetical protein JHC93_01790 [Parachlamydiales bacterium]|nr:hypothetical protein [Parachlamydiales bacterium]